MSRPAAPAPGEGTQATGRSSFRLNRREYPRYALVRCSAILHSGGTKEVCLVQNISAAGMMARIYRPLALDDRVEVEFAAGLFVEGRVLWAKDWTVGIAFEQLIDVEAVVAVARATDPTAERRRGPRLALDCPAQLRVNSRFYHGRIRDISEGGARFQSARSLKKTGPVLLLLPEMPPLAGAVRWIDGQECGLAFNETIPEEALERWVAGRARAAKLRGGDSASRSGTQPAARPRSAVCRRRNNPVSSP